jgi:hypothetical protein
MMQSIGCEAIRKAIGPAHASILVVNGRPVSTIRETLYRVGEIFNLRAASFAADLVSEISLPPAEGEIFQAFVTRRIASIDTHRAINGNTVYDNKQHNYVTFTDSLKVGLIYDRPIMIYEESTDNNDRNVHDLEKAITKFQERTGTPMTRVAAAAAANVTAAVSTTTASTSREKDLLAKIAKLQLMVDKSGRTGTDFCFFHDQCSHSTADCKKAEVGLRKLDIDELTPRMLAAKSPGKVDGHNSGCLAFKQKVVRKQKS